MSDTYRLDVNVVPEPLTRAPASAEMDAALGGMQISSLDAIEKLIDTVDPRKEP